MSEESKRMMDEDTVIRDGEDAAMEDDAVAGQLSEAFNELFNLFQNMPESLDDEEDQDKEEQNEEPDKGKDDRNDEEDKDFVTLEEDESGFDWDGEDAVMEEETASEQDSAPTGGVFDFLQRMQSNFLSNGLRDKDDESAENTKSNFTDMAALDAEDYHNMAVLCSKKGDPKRALDICQKGLSRFGSNIDLLADVVKYAATVGQEELAQQYCGKLLALPRTVLGWRAYMYMLEYLQEDLLKNEALCRELIADFRQYLPYDEKSYVAESELEEKLGNRLLSRKILEDVINLMPNASMSALRLADMQLESGAYEETVRTVNYALMASAETRPSINIAYMVYVRCLAEDALLHKKVLKNGYVSESEVAELRAQYKKLTKSFPELAARFDDTITVRIELLSFIKTR